MYILGLPGLGFVVFCTERENCRSLLITSKLFNKTHTSFCHTNATRALNSGVQIYRFSSPNIWISYYPCLSNDCYSYLFKPPTNSNCRCAWHL